MHLKGNLIFPTSILIIFLFLFSTLFAETIFLYESTLGNTNFNENNSNSQKIISELNPNYEVIGKYAWNDAEVIEPNINLLNDIKIALDNEQNVHLFWSESKNNKWELYHKIKYINGSWGDIEKIGTTTNYAYGLMSVKTDQLGRIHIIWRQNDSLKYKMYNNGVWSQVSTIGNGYKPCLQITENNTPRVLYYSVNDFYSISYIYKGYNEIKKEWFLIEELPYNAYEAFNFDFHLTYKNGEEKSYFISNNIERYTRPTRYTYNWYLLKKDNLSASFSLESYQQISIPSNFYQISKPVLFSDHDEIIYVVYILPLTVNSYQITYQQETEQGWSSPSALSTHTTLTTDMSISVDQMNRIILVWNDKTSGVRGVYFKVFSPITKEWSSDYLINPSIGYSYYPYSTIDSEGNIHVAWVYQNSTHRILYYRHASTDSDEDGLFNIEERDIYGTDPYNADTDEDQLNDGSEVTLGFDPLNPDEDIDGMADGYEYNYGLNPYINDSYEDLDLDGLINIQEFLHSTYPNNNDSDNDQLTDFDEVVTYLTYPMDSDTDNDKIKDGVEVITLGSNPKTNDTDSDGMDDYYEYNWNLKILENDTLEDPDGDGLFNIYEYQYNLRPDLADNDYDGLNDYQEVMVYYTNPKYKDTDIDYLDDIDELFGIYSPTNPGANATGYIHTNPLKKDSDGDLLRDKLEIENNLNPNSNDTDNDLMFDGYEWYLNLNATDPSDALLDYDNDGLTNYEESLIWTNPFLIDTDADELTDKEELAFGSDPTLFDTDHDGIDDYNEIIVLGTNVTNPDTDYDGLNDYKEVHVYESNPFIQDSDSDGITDGDEVYIYKSNPITKDSDGDLLEDLDELVFGSDPILVDSDSDGMDDYFEWLYNLNPQINDSNNDNDKDGIDNGEEFSYKSNPLINDTDFDGLSDYQEIAIYYTLPYSQDSDNDELGDYNEIFFYFSNPLDPDSDDDRLLDGEETLLGTNPIVADTDKDGIDDGKELEDGTNPLDPSDNQNKNRLQLIIISFCSIIGGLIIYYLGPVIFIKILKNTEISWIKEGINFHKNKYKKILKTKQKQ